jgi:hypothetical protein
MHTNTRNVNLKLLKVIYILPTLLHPSFFKVPHRRTRTYVT